MGKNAAEAHKLTPFSKNESFKADYVINIQPITFHRDFL